MPTIIHGGTVVTGNPRGDILQNASIVVDNGIISKIHRHGEARKPEGDSVDAQGLVLIPGFIQTHVHLCQTLFRGLADDLPLLDWLQKRIFPFEAAHTESSMHASAMLGIAELLRSGTTTILDMGSVHHEEELIRAIGESGMRAFAGKAMMDVNDLYPKLKEPAKEAISSTRSLIEGWHNSFDGRVRYAVAPRFVLSCSDGLLHAANEMLASYEGVLFHTHASENVTEVEEVRKRCGMENIEFLHHLGLLSGRACLAHCIHLSEAEVGILAKDNVSITHCPSSNLKLGSGIAKVPGLMNRGINVSLGADGAPCNNALDMFREMRLASLLQKPYHGSTAMPAKLVFEMATRAGAKSLGMEDELGSLEEGKHADLVMLNLNNVWDPATSENLYSSIVYSAGPENVDSVMISGEWVYRKKAFEKLDEENIVATAQKELKQLLTRAEVR